MTVHVTFAPAPASGVTLNLPAGALAANYTLPVVDPNNVDTMIANNSSGVAWLAFAAGGSVGPNAPGCISVLTGQMVLLTATAAVLAAAQNALIVGGAQAGAAATTTTVSVMSQYAGPITITRGTASAQVAFA